MSKTSVIAIFDVGKTNKKLLLFDENYRVVYERSTKLLEVVDEDGDSCEDLRGLCSLLYRSLQQVLQEKNFHIKALNFSAYGASLVYIDNKGKTLTPLYNYLKPYPVGLINEFYQKYGGEASFSKQTASPVLGSLNSGLQIYRLCKEQPELFSKIQYALHLPQYLSYLFSKQPCSEITSIGCHTNLWDFTKNCYHNWVEREGMLQKLAPILPSSTVVSSVYERKNIKVGVGLHDSSAALIPYLLNFPEPFILLSTGTWCISFNPFNSLPLTEEELTQDCLCYLQYKGASVKASRFFAGFEHDQQVGKISTHFNQNKNRYQQLSYNHELATELLRKGKYNNCAEEPADVTFAFSRRNLSDFDTDEEAYHQLMIDLVAQQVKSTKLVLEGTNVKRIFVDGGFSQNSIFMHLLASSFEGMEVFAASMAQATALGAALVIHSVWNNKPLPADLIKLRYYSINRLAL